MNIKQFFDNRSSTFTYCVVDEEKSIAALIDPVLDNIEEYLEYLSQNDLTLAYVLDTHTHADHISANGVLRETLVGCKTLMGKEALAECVDDYFADGDAIEVGKIVLNVLHTPGHTDDSYCFHIPSHSHSGRADILFTGDTLMINGSGRTDFQNGNAYDQYQSLFGKLLTFPEHTIVYPGHDYRGNAQSTIGQEKKHNPRLQVSTAEEYVKIMDNLNLPTPKLMDVAVPANQKCGQI